MSSQANLTEDQIRYVGELKKGEAIVHTGFIEQAVNVQIPHFREKYVQAGKPRTNERIALWMQAYYSSRPYMKE